MGAELILEGFDEFYDLLNKVSNPQEAENFALNAAAKYYEDKVKTKIPKSKLSKEHAADHMTITKPARDSNGTPYVQCGIDKSNNDEFFYMKFYEYGTTNKNALGVTIPAQHFFENTISEEQANIQNVMQQAVAEKLGL